MPTQNRLLQRDHTLTAGQQTDPTGSTCADARRCGRVVLVAGCRPRRRVSRAPAARPTAARWSTPSLNGSIPLAVFNQSLARVLYQEERFGMLGCDQTPTAACTNPGGIGGDRSGTAPLPAGPTSGTPVLGTKNGDAAIVEKYSEEGATLLKNDGGALPLKSSDISRRHPRHRREREPHGRRPDERGVDRLHRPRRDQPAAAAESVQRHPRTRSRSCLRTTRRPASADLRALD